MDDRTLLEMAAKAAGYKVRWHEPWGCFVHTAVINTTNPLTLAGQRHIWAPLDDDGDALRLASALYMIVSHGPCQASASTIEGTLRGFQAIECTISQDQGQAVRRAIVRAAAEIGRAMK